MLTVCEFWVNAFWKGRNLLTNISKITASLKEPVGEIFVPRHRIQHWQRCFC